MIDLLHPLSLSCCATQIARIVGPDTAEADLVPLFNMFLKDVDDVKVGVVQSLAKFLAALSISTRETYLPVLGECRPGRAQAACLRGCGGCVSPSEDVGVGWGMVGEYWELDCWRRAAGGLWSRIDVVHGTWRVALGYDLVTWCGPAPLLSSAGGQRKYCTPLRSTTGGSGTCWPSSSHF